MMTINIYNSSVKLRIAWKELAIVVKEKISSYFRNLKVSPSIYLRETERERMNEREQVIYSIFCSFNVVLESGGKNKVTSSTHK